MFYTLHQLSCGTRDSKISGSNLDDHITSCNPTLFSAWTLSDVSSDSKIPRNPLQSHELSKIRLYISVLSPLPRKSGNSKES